MRKKALISVSNKEGIVAFAQRLTAKGFEVISTGSTAQHLREGGVTVREVSEVTGFPEIMDGRVKTLHPKIFGGILAVRNNPEHQKALQENEIGQIDVVVVNLYPFEETLAGGETNEAVLIEKIDIGGPSLIRAAAKNFADVTVIVDTADYERVASEIEKNGETALETRRRLACKAFERTQHYDEAISAWMREITGQPELLDLHYEKVRSLRYGENPHQKAAFFRNPENHDPNVTNSKVLHGKELSFNNIVDANSALELVKEFERPTVVFIKHNNPCGVASSEKIERAFDLSFQVDSKSAFGSVVALNRPLNMACAQYIRDHKIFIELIICPSFEKDALEMLMQRKNIRLLETGPLSLDTEKRDIKKVAGGILVQSANTIEVAEGDLKVVTKKKPSQEEIRAMLFANKVCKHVMSNAVIFAKRSNRSSDEDYVVTGIGAGQMSRVDAVTIAQIKGGERVPGSVMASDAFFPFPDAVEEAAKAGVTSIVSPGGSVNDEEVITRADELGVAMVFSGVRLFRH
ncbi:bifunctional phosphoribosylaminoimidazolecarboxamide formyltransferase/inosine monophosphate cyclohydrolase [Candidatus Peregrinibacteria bacterium CG11_big_fil_rev_8_21_14_0_20_46_8]|nr:MAG: bifunctional phosphoribosylaminoimidazolecarboxamide formyltransferase/inosine monophosphate cyclohydrolase [Candidatus Peregrinibacteria bacterium CG11_big_fil_rev_8_21_14_0_20_46_8]